jgi:hypothetical protein
MIVFGKNGSGDGVIIWKFYNIEMRFYNIETVTLLELLIFVQHRSPAPKQRNNRSTEIGRRKRLALIGSAGLADSIQAGMLKALSITPFEGSR